MASRAACLAAVGTLSSRSSTTASAPLAKALSKRSGRLPGTNSSVRARARGVSALISICLLRLDRAELAQARDIRCCPAELSQDCLGMLAQARHRVHARRIGIGLAWWQQAGNGTYRCFDAGTAVACLPIGMFPHVVHVVHMRIGDLRFFEPLHDIVGRQRADDLR